MYSKKKKTGKTTEIISEVNLQFYLVIVQQNLEQSHLTQKKQKTEQKQQRLNRNTERQSTQTQN